MLTNTSDQNTSIQKYDQEQFHTSMLALQLFIICSSTPVYLKVTSGIQCQLLKRTTRLYYRRKSKQIIPTSLLKNGSSQQLCHFCLDWTYRYYQISASTFTFGRIFYTKKQERNCQHICYHFCSYTQVGLSLL